jgi:hypothetical protein
MEILGGGGPYKEIERREAKANPQITNISDHYLACGQLLCFENHILMYSSCYSGHGPGPYSDDEKDIIKRCAKKSLKRDPNIPIILMYIWRRRDLSCGRNNADDSGAMSSSIEIFP